MTPPLEPSLATSDRRSKSSAPELDPVQLAEWDHAHVWHPFTARDWWESREPLIIHAAEGVELIDLQGRRYLDGVSSLWCNVHGHRHPVIDQAIRDQLDRLAHSTLLGVAHPPAIELAKRLADLAPPGLTRVFFSDNGSTAVESAVKMAFQYWRNKPDPEPDRTLFMTLGDAYHGDTLGDVSLGGIELFHAAFGPLLFPTLRIPTPHPYRDPQRRSPDQVRDHCLGVAERLFQTHGPQVAAVVAEPLIQGAAGLLVHPPGFLKGLRDLCDRYGTLLICDEVAVGFGRTGTMFACEQEKVIPDFLCLAKGITAGYLPLAATLTHERIYDAFLGSPECPKTFYHGHTFSGNPLAAAAALASLRVFEEEKTLETLPPKIAHLRHRLEQFARLPQVGDVRGVGLMAGIELVENIETRASFPPAWRIGARVCQRARDYGVLTRPLGDVLVIVPPLAVTIADLDRLFDALEAAWNDVREGRA